MRKNFLVKYLWVFLLLGISPHAKLQALTVWNGNVTTDVTDDDISITGDVTIGSAIVQHVHVNATTVDVSVTPSAAWTISPNDAAGACAANARALHFVAAAGRTITLDLSLASLTFRSGNQNFLVNFSGAGNLAVRMGDNQTLTISDSGLLGSTTGVFFMANMSTTAHTPATQAIRFFRDNIASNNNTQVIIGPNSVLGFMGDDTSLATQTAAIGFDGSNNIANTGRLALVVFNGGSAAIQGYNTANLGGDMLSCDIDFTTLAGQHAIYQTMSFGPGLFSGFGIFNTNELFPGLRRNPWCLDDNVVGFQPGFVLGANGVFDVADQTYVDYIGATTNFSPEPEIPEEILANLAVNCVSPLVNQVVKDRNASAFIVDGPASYCSGIISAQPPVNWIGRPQIIMHGTSKIYFRSAVGCNGLESEDLLVDPEFQLTDRQGYGSIVFDVEGALDIIDADGTGNGKTLSILSIQEADTGGSVLIEASDVNFKLRTYARDGNGDYLQYGKGAFLVNGRMNFWGAIEGNFGLGLQHTDVLHKVFEKNAIQQSEATYIGGETFRLCPATLGERPTIAFYWATLFLHTSAAFTGVDIRVPSLPSTTDTDNPSFVAFYHNGFCADQGTGRSLIMGTDIGALASDLGTIINRDAHNDILQEFPLNEGAEIVEFLVTRANNNKVTEGLPATQLPNPLDNQYSQHSFYLAHASNISVGTPGLVSPNPCSEVGFNVLANSVLFVGGSFIAFESQGGLLNEPDTSVETGQGGIFVDQGGLFEVASTQRMSLAAMVGLGFNGAVDFLNGTVFINNLVGITRSNLDMSDPNQVVVVPANANITDFTIDWKYTIKDTCPPSATPNYFPYMPVAVPAACQNPVAVAANVTNVPTVLGVVDQLQIANSRLGDPATIKVSGTVAPGPTVTGAIVREVVFNATTPDSGAAPVGIIVIENNGYVGLGSASRNQDSPAAAVVLGINGITLMPNGDGEVFLNQNAVINNVCQIVAGPDFGVGGPHTLIIYSDVATEIRVKQGATLDLSQFNSPNRRLEIGGEVSLIFEPGSRMVLGEYVEGEPQQAEIHFVDNAIVRLDALTLPNIPTGSLAASDAYRVKWGGAGRLVFEENSLLDIPRGALLGIESSGLALQLNPIGIDQDPLTLVNCPWLTDIDFILEDSGHVYIGSDTDYGGALQVGNTADHTNDGAAVNFSIQINGPDAEFEVNSQGFLGLAVGVVAKPNGGPNDSTVAPTFNVDEIVINNNLGTFKSRNIFLGSSTEAGLIALGPVTTGYTFTLNANPTAALVLGGGNLVQISGQTAPTVLTTDGVINANLSAGILASRPTLGDPSKTVPAFPATATVLFNYLKANSFQSQIIPKAQANFNDFGTISLGYVTDTTIARPSVQGVYGADGSYSDPTRSLELGAVGLALGNDGTPRAYIIRP